MVAHEQVNIIMAGLHAEIRALLNDVDRGLVDREQAARALALTMDTARHEMLTVLPLGARGEISYRAG